MVRDVRPVSEFGLSTLPRTVSAAINGTHRLQAVSYDGASAVRATRRERVNCAFEAIERMTLLLHDDLERAVVVVSAHFTGRHCHPLVAPWSVVGSGVGSPISGGVGGSVGVSGDGCSGGTSRSSGCLPGIGAGRGGGVSALTMRTLSWKRCVWKSWFVGSGPRQRTATGASAQLRSDTSDS
jgi:hypothetical protein